ncbi:hypothetical protein GGI20_006047 [Coemansia sp. BCRC 34301]|nr:hypothetical protein GGI20_006047 [Coemansia sp. BCRC 34301]
MWDRCVDRESRCPGAYPLEKLVGARYLGEIVRNLITDLMDERLLFAQTADPSVINTPYAFHSLYIAPIVEDKEMARRILDTEFGVALSDADCIVVKALCKIVAKRSALIVAALVAALVMRAGGMPVVALSGVLVDGNQSLVDEAVAAMQSLVNRDVQVLLQPRGAEVLGAAVMAAS